MFLVILVAFCFSAVNAASISSGRGDGIYPHDITNLSELTAVYNMPVRRAEKVERPWLAFIPHKGVRVTTADGKQWLIHKGSGYGCSSQTVMVDAIHMSDRWNVLETKLIRHSTVADYVRAGGDTYRLIGDNCYDAADRMMMLN